MLCCCCGYQQLLIIPDCGLAWSGWKTVYADRMHSNAGAAAGTLKLWLVHRDMSMYAGICDCCWWMHSLYMVSCVAAPALLVCCIDSVSEVILHSVLELCPALELISQGTSATIHICSKVFLPVKVLLLSCVLVSTALVTAMQTS